VCTAKQDGGEETADDEEGRKGRGIKRRRKCGEKWEDEREKEGK
jgi:hypothetical protein